MDDEEEFVHFLLLSIFLRLFQTNTNKNQQQQQQTTMMRLKLISSSTGTVPGTCTYRYRYLLLLPPMEALLLLVEPGWGAGRVFKKIVDVFFSLNIFAMKHIGSFNVF
jgi:hypothetical protein